MHFIVSSHGSSTCRAIDSFSSKTYFTQNRMRFVCFFHAVVKQKRKKKEINLEQKLNLIVFASYTIVQELHRIVSISTSKNYEPNKLFILSALFLPHFLWSYPIPSKCARNFVCTSGRRKKTENRSGMVCGEIIAIDWKWNSLLELFG